MFGGVAGGNQHRVLGFAHGFATAEIHLPAAGYAIDSGHIVARVNGNYAGDGEGFGRVNAYHTGVGVGAAHKVGVEHSRQHNIVGIAAFAGDKTLVFDALYGLSNEFIAHELFR